MNKKYEKLKQKALLKLILAREEQLIVELRAMHLSLVESYHRRCDCDDEKITEKVGLVEKKLNENQHK